MSSQVSIRFIDERIFLENYSQVFCETTAMLVSFTASLALEVTVARLLLVWNTGLTCATTSGGLGVALLARSIERGAALSCVRIALRKATGW